MSPLFAIDGPLIELQTPAKELGKWDDFVMAGSMMALVHNVFIRGYNSIYLQATKVKFGDLPDFLQYCRVWHALIKLHHDSEEVRLFPTIEEKTGKKGIMDTELDEHEAFSKGLEEYISYITTAIEDPTIFKGTKLVSIMDGFGAALNTHLAHEPPKLAALSKYDFNIKECFEEEAKYTQARASVVGQFPMVWHNLDVSIEDGRWSNFPEEIPGAVKWVMINVISRWYSNWWRFGSCGADGVQRPLLCLTPAYNEG